MELWYTLGYIDILWIALGLQIRVPRSTNHKQWIILTIAQFSLSVFVVIIFMFCGLGSCVLLFLQTQRNPQYPGFKGTTYCTWDLYTVVVPLKRPRTMVQIYIYYCTSVSGWILHEWEMYFCKPKGEYKRCSWVQYPAIFHFHECSNVFITHFHRDWNSTTR